MTLDELLGHLKGFGIVPTLIALVYFHRVIRPLLVEARDFGILAYALAYGWARKEGIDLDAERKLREGEIPEVPEAPNVIGVVRALTESQADAKRRTGT